MSKTTSAAHLYMSIYCSNWANIKIELFKRKVCFTFGIFCPIEGQSGENKYSLVGLVSNLKH